MFLAIKASVDVEVYAIYLRMVGVNCFHKFEIVHHNKTLVWVVLVKLIEYNKLFIEPVPVDFSIR